MGTAGSFPKMARSHGCWQEASGFSTGPLRFPVTGQLTSPKGSDPRETKEEATVPFMT